MKAIYIDSSEEEESPLEKRLSERRVRRFLAARNQERAERKELRRQKRAAKAEQARRPAERSLQKKTIHAPQVTPDRCPVSATSLTPDTAAFNLRACFEAKGWVMMSDARRGDWMEWREKAPFHNEHIDADTDFLFCHEEADRERAAEIDEATRMATQPTASNEPSSPSSSPLPMLHIDVESCVTHAENPEQYWKDVHDALNTLHEHKHQSQQIAGAHPAGVHQVEVSEAPKQPRLASKDISELEKSVPAPPSELEQHTGVITTAVASTTAAVRPPPVKLSTVPWPHDCLPSIPVQPRRLRVPTFTVIWTVLVRVSLRPELV